jgi:hypothetical protein
MSNKYDRAGMVALAGLALLLAALTGLFYVYFHRTGEAPQPDSALFPFRTDPPPREWRTNQINDGLPYHWEGGAVHLLAWEVIEDDRPWKYTQVLVLKRFHRPTEKGGHRWVLAQVYHHPEDNEWPWRGPMRIPPPFPISEKEPKMTDAQLFGHEFFNDPPTDEQVQKLLKETMWTPDLGTREAYFLSGSRPLTTKLTAGGINPLVWKQVFGRDVPADLFPELKKETDDQP